MALTPTRLAELSRRIDAMLALPVTERAAWLDALPPEDADLQPYLRDLLAATEQGALDDSASAKLPQARAGLARQALDAAAAPGHGDVVGPYRLLRPLGRGGMGVVWLAERIDGAMKREVALKLPLLGPQQQRRWIERFERERDILASLDHPHIARLYDAGWAADGQPYLALEVIDGTPITTHCDNARLDVARRIAMFLQVLQAVQFAHNHLVVHRDLKPSNILVSADGQVHLLDFGIALPIDEASAGDAPLTEVGQALLTPDYAAPEQLVRGPVSTVSDVYSLGVVLFELLCGRRPYQPTHGSRAALEEAVLNTEPMRPSRAAGDRPALARRLRGDLDNILLKALNKDAARRYASADAFAEDLRRHLAGAPVLAHPDSLGYRARKFVARNRVAVAAGGAVALALVAGTGVALWQAGVAREQAAQAQRESRKARAVQDYLVGLFNAASPARAQGREQTVRQLLEAGERDLKPKLSGEPELAAALGGALVDIYLQLEDGKRALALAQSRAELLARTVGTGSADYAVTLYTIGAAHLRLHQYEAADEALGRAEPLLARHAARLPKQWLDFLKGKAESLAHLQRDDEAMTVLSTLIPQAAAHHGANAWEVLSLKAGLAYLRSKSGDCQRAAPLVREVEPWLREPPADRGVESAALRVDLGSTMWKCGQLPEAIALLNGQAANLDRLEGGPMAGAAVAQMTLGRTLLDAGKYRQASDTLQDFARRVAPQFEPNPRRLALANTLQVEPLVLLNRLEEAMTAARAAGGTAVPTMQALVLLFEGQAAQARALLQPLVQPGTPPPGFEQTAARRLLFLAGAELADHRADQAALHAAAAAATWQREPGQLFYDQVMMHKAHLTEAMALAAAGSVPAAQARLDESVPVLRSLLGNDHPALRMADLVRARVLRAAGRAGEAQAIDRTARDALRRDHGITLPAEIPLVL